MPPVPRAPCARRETTGVREETAPSTEPGCSSGSRRDLGQVVSPPRGRAPSLHASPPPCSPGDSPRGVRAASSPSRPAGEGSELPAGSPGARGPSRHLPALRVTSGGLRVEPGCGIHFAPRCQPRPLGGKAPNPSSTSRRLRIRSPPCGTTPKRHPHWGPPGPFPPPGDPACPAKGAEPKAHARPRASGRVFREAARYLSTVTLPLLTGRKRTGSDTLMGLNWNLQPKQSAESLKKDTETMGLSKMWMGSTWETMQPPGW